jgi:preprotein translocase subunit Sss1
MRFSWWGRRLQELLMAGTPSRDELLMAGTPSRDELLMVGTPSRDELLMVGTPSRDEVLMVRSAVFGASRTMRFRKRFANVVE